MKKKVTSGNKLRHLVHPFSLQRQLLPFHLNRMSLLLKLSILLLKLLADLTMIFGYLLMQAIKFLDLSIVVSLELFQAILIGYGELLNFRVVCLGEISLHSGYAIHLLLKLHLLHFCGYLAC